MKTTLCYCALAFLAGYIVSGVVGREMTRKAPADPQNTCHVVTHNSSDGFSYWSCEKN